MLHPAPDHSIDHGTCGEAEAAEFLSSYGLTESGLTRLIRKTYELLGMISFFTVGEDECRAWTVERGSRAQTAAGAIHSEGFRPGLPDALHD